MDTMYTDTWWKYIIIIIIIIIIFYWIYKDVPVVLLTKVLKLLTTFNMLLIPLITSAWSYEQKPWGWNIHVGAGLQQSA